MKLYASSFLVPDWPAPESVCAYTSTRSGGCSEGPYEHFNLALHVADDAAHVERNRTMLAEYLGLARADFHWLEQVHGSHVNTIGVESLSSGRNAVRLPQADVSYTRLAGQVCLVMTADCLPVLFCDRAGTQVAAAHAGWRGLCAGVLEQTLAHFEVSSDVMAWLGPAIGPAHFEVGPEVREAFVAAAPEAKSAFTTIATQSGVGPQKYRANLYQLARQRLSKAGVSAIYGGDLCTYSDPSRYYSYRRDGEASGRMASLIFLRP